MSTYHHFFKHIAFFFNRENCCSLTEMEPILIFIAFLDILLIVCTKYQVKCQM